MGTLLLLGALAGCSGDDLSEVGSLERDVADYRAAVVPLSEQLAELSRTPAEADLAAARAALSAYGLAAAAAADQLDEGHWSDELQVPIDELVTVLEDQADLFEELAALPDLAEIQAQVDRSGESIFDARAAAAGVEEALDIDDGLLGPATNPSSTVPTPS